MLEKKFGMVEVKPKLSIELQFDSRGSEAEAEFDQHILEASLFILNLARSVYKNSKDEHFKKVLTRLSEEENAAD